ncbi:MAG: peptide deformylase [Pseudomonadota bacterium]
MAVMQVVYHPNEILRQTLKPVTEFDDKLQKLVDDMFETMYAVRGVGLAANQVGLDMSLSVIDVSESKDQRLVIVNPEVIEARDFVLMQEGCLSLPTTFDSVPRPKWIKVKAQDVKGNRFEIEAEDLLAECLHHEIDHLNGKLYIDYLSKLKQKRIRTKLDKYKRELKKHG